MDIRYFDINGAQHDISCKLFLPDISPLGIVIGVHGFGGDKESSVLELLAERINERYALLCFDFPSHGKSNAPDNALTVENCADDLVSVFEYAKANFPSVPIFMFSTSFGGYTTLLAVKQGRITPEKVVLRAPAINMANIFRDKILGEDFDIYRTQGYIAWGFDRKMNVPYDFYRGLSSNNVSSVFMKVPTLVFCATEDELVEPHDLHEFANAGERVEIYDVVGASHRFKGQGEIDEVVERTVRFIM